MDNFDGNFGNKMFSDYMVKEAFSKFMNGVIEDFSEVTEVMDVKPVRIQNHDSAIEHKVVMPDGDLRDPNINDDELGVLIYAAFRLANEDGGATMKTEGRICFWKHEYYLTVENNKNIRYLFKKLEWSYEMMGQLQKKASEWTDANE